MSDTISRTYDSLHVGRSSIDLYGNDGGSPLINITSFAAYVGGSPTNMSVGVRRLGLKSAIVTGVGYDPVGDFILNFLNNEGVDTKYTVRKQGKRSNAVVLGIEPPDKFPLVYYRDNCADIELSIDDVLAAPIADSKVFQFAGTNLYKEPNRSATMFGAEVARRVGTEVIFGVDFRPDQWHDPRAFGVVVRSVLPLVDIVIGTKDEINAAMLMDTSQMQLTHSQLSATKVSGDSERAIECMLTQGPKAVVEKIGGKGARIHLDTGEKIDVDGYPVEIYNILGAGDAFGAGFIYGHVNGWGWHKSARLGNACGAIIGAKHGCANFMPTYDEVMVFVGARGGLD